MDGGSRVGAAFFLGLAGVGVEVADCSRPPRLPSLTPWLIRIIVGVVVDSMASPLVYRWPLHTRALSDTWPLRCGRSPIWMGVTPGDDFHVRRSRARNSMSRKRGSCCKSLVRPCTSRHLSARGWPRMAQAELTARCCSRPDSPPFPFLFTFLRQIAFSRGLVCALYDGNQSHYIQNVGGWIGEPADPPGRLARLASDLPVQYILARWTSLGLVGVKVVTEAWCCW